MTRPRVRSGAMRKVLVIGPGGAGKSTLARRLADVTGLPLVHLDALYWRPGWRPTPNEEWDRVIGELCAREAWVMDGNDGRTLPARLAACDTVIFLDTPRWRCLWRLVRRWLRCAGRVIVLRGDRDAEQLIAELRGGSDAV